MKKFTLPKLTTIAIHKTLIISIALGLSLIACVLAYTQVLIKSQKINQLSKENTALSKNLKQSNKDLTDLKNQDQYKINQGLQANIKNIQDTYAGSIDAYQKILDLQTQNQKVSPLLTEYAQTVNYLSKLNYASGSASLLLLNSDVQKQEDALAAAAAATAGSSGGLSTPPPVSNTAPGGGFSQQSVNTPNGTFVVDIIAADIGSTRVIADTASNGDCSNNCPTLALSDYVSRSGAYAGINGSFFCPVDYPSCAGKTGSFDTLLMNKNKVYFNSANNVYSSVPAVIVGDSYIRFVGASSQWGRDTSPNMVLAMQPGLIFGGNVAFNGSDDPKYGSKGTRGFIAHKGNTIFIGDVLGATMSDSAQVMKALGMDDAINLDEGGSTALWFGGYKLGPGRNIPNAILFVHK